VTSSIGSPASGPVEDLELDGLARRDLVLVEEDLLEGRQAALLDGRTLRSMRKMPTSLNSLFRR